MLALLLVVALAVDDFDKRCLATDDSGAVIAQAVSEDALACREQVKAQLTALRCTGERQSVPYRYQRGRGRAIAAVLYCR